MVLLGLIFQFIFSLVFFFFVGLLAVLAATAAGLGFAFFIFPLIILVLFGVIPLLLLYVAYAFVYKRIRDRQYEAAKGPLLILAIIEIIFGGVLPGIFYIIGYVKLGDVINESRQMMMGQQPGWNPGYPQQPPMAQPYAAPPGQQPAYASPPGASAYPPAAAPAASPAPGATAVPNCPKCGRPATFVPQYNRYYCYTDAQYV